MKRVSGCKNSLKNIEDMAASPSQSKNKISVASATKPLNVSDVCVLFSNIDISKNIHLSTSFNTTS